ncbi:MAG: L,D-transpeptidase family protein [Patescibacteria group bacterium]|nr:L,D-transpeptidase family protein [Patescibacteria group bacterium]
MKKNNNKNKKNKGNKYKFITIVLAVVLIFLSGSFFLFWKKVQNTNYDVYYRVPENKSFIYESDIEQYGFEDYIKEKIEKEKINLINENRSFIDVDLEEMEISLYEEGEKIKTFSAVSKGREGSWWETPPGFYFVGDTIATHFSSVAQVWMPYAVQFYGNFFIHGWPYDYMGRGLSAGPSGGCIRMNTADAKEVFLFAERGMPVLVFNKKETPFLPAITIPDEDYQFSEQVSAENFMLADIETGEIILNKDKNAEINGEPLVRPMLAVVFSETVNLERRITARSWMIEGFSDGVIFPNASYTGSQLLEKTLTTSSKEPLLVLTRFLTPEHFKEVVNAKARSIGMENTFFSDIFSFSEENITTPVDVAKAMRYIYQYRGFVFDRSSTFKGAVENGKESRFTVLKIEKEGRERAILFIITESDDVDGDFQKMKSWLSF